jgi:hypothetical protein
MARTCSSLQNNENVVFKIYSEIYKKKIYMDGHIISINDKVKKAWVCWLEGYKSRNDLVPFEDMVAVYDLYGEKMKFDNISGPSVLLIPE